MPLSEHRFTATLSQPDRFTAVLEPGTPIPGPPGQPREIRDEGVAMPVRTVINMTGAGVTATDDEAGDQTVITIPGAAAPPVASVFGRIGAVIAQAGDYVVAQITGAVSTARRIIAGPGLDGGGDLTGDVTLTADVKTVQGRTGNVVIDLAELGGVPEARRVIAGTGLTGGGDLSGDVTLSVDKAEVQATWVTDVSAAGYKLQYVRRLHVQDPTVTGSLGFAFESGADATLGPLVFSIYQDAGSAGSQRFTEFRTGDYHAYRNLVLCRYDGNVGICNSSPAYRLDVTGDINTTGNYRKNGTIVMLTVEDIVTALERDADLRNRLKALLQ